MHWLHSIYPADTTDVQTVTVVATENSNEVQIRCDFIPGSDAQGCMVVWWY